MRLVLNKKEIFPVFCWSLFSVVPSQPVQEFAVVLTEIDEKTLEPGADLISQKYTPAPIDRVVNQEIVQKLGSSVEKHSSGRESASRKLLEAKYDGALFKKNLKYLLVKRSYDAVERWNNGPVHDQTMKEYAIEKRPVRDN